MSYKKTKLSVYSSICYNHLLYS